MKQKISETDLMKSWDWEKNNALNLNPENITLGSRIKIFWLCEKNHSWQAPAYTRAKGHGCPFCGKRRILKGFNDFETFCKSKKLDYLLEEWNFDKNTIKPSEVSAYSEKKVWWVCSSGHSYLKKISERFMGEGCPICARVGKTSFPEQAVFFYIHKYYPTSINRFSTASISEIDIYIPEQKIGIEYNGNFWHKQKKEKDLEKEKNILSQGIIFFKINEDKNASEVHFENNTITYSPTYNYESLNLVIEILLANLNIRNFDININRDRSEILKQYYISKKENDLKSKFPNLAEEWNYEKNNGLLPENFSFASNHAVWWKCKNGHEWKIRISSRTINKAQCPYCSGRKTIGGENDLLTKAPKLVKEWNYDKNAPLSPSEIKCCYKRKVWWKCEKGHEWQAAVYSRFLDKTDCPYCKNKKILSGFNDLATLNPKLAAEWNYEKNNNMSPSEIGIMFSKKVWWKCKNGHEWQATVAHRTNGNNCPLCRQKKVVQIMDGKVIHVFDSICSASKITGTSKGAISNCCKGIQKSAGGYNWKYET